MGHELAPPAECFIRSAITSWCDGTAQDLASWTRDGVAGLQSVVLYSLPELDGAIDTVPLGGLVGNDIFLVQVTFVHLHTFAFVNSAHSYIRFVQCCLPGFAALGACFGCQL